MMDYDIRHGRTYMYFKGQPLYPFGYGLSYTTFQYSNLQTSAPQLNAAGEIDVRVDVTNTGKKAGDEVVQLYVKHIGSKVDRPLEELKGFQRIALKAGETQTVQFSLKAEALAYWDAANHGWTVEADQVEIRLGGSSANTPVTKIVSIQR